MTATPSRDDLARYLDMIFGYVDFADEHAGCIVLRGIGEKGTDKSGRPYGNHAIRGDLGMKYLTDRVFDTICRWGDNSVGSFIVPAVMDVSCLEKGAPCGDDKVRFFTTLLVDIDRGDPASSVNHASAFMGRPSMVVRSGGTTDQGKPKLHVYWRLTEPSANVRGIAAARKNLALKLGGDPSFGRISQVIRLPGSIYLKNNNPKLCAIEDFTSDEYNE